MSLPQMHAAGLRPDQLARLQAFESRVGKTIVAVQADPEFAHLKPAEVKELEALEKDLGAVLLAYESE